MSTVKFDLSNHGSFATEASCSAFVHAHVRVPHCTLQSFGDWTFPSSRNHLMVCRRNLRVGLGWKCLRTHGRRNGGKRCARAHLTTWIFWISRQVQRINIAFHETINSKSGLLRVKIPKPKLCEKLVQHSGSRLAKKSFTPNSSTCVS